MTVPAAPEIGRNRQLYLLCAVRYRVYRSGFRYRSTVFLLFPSRVELVGTEGHFDSARS